MKRIYKAINEGIHKSIIDFGQDEKTFKKSTKMQEIEVKEFESGQYVCYCNRFGYNNMGYGDKVGICLLSNTDGQQGLFLSFNRTFIGNTTIPCTNTAIDIQTSYADGWKNTLDVIRFLKNTNQLEGTMWDLLEKNEYIPSQDELFYIYDAYNKLHLFEFLSGWNDEHIMSSTFFAGKKSSTVSTLNWYGGENEQDFPPYEPFNTFLCFHVK